MIIYKITNKINGKAYIGQTVGELRKRWAVHCASNYCRALHNAIKKYGKDAFKLEVIKECSSHEEMNELEKNFIVEHKTRTPAGYNLKEGGSNGSPSEETKAKMSAAHKGKKHTDEARAKISAAKLGYKFSQEARAKMSASQMGNKSAKGNKISPEHKARLLACNLGRKLSEEHKAKLLASNLGKKISDETKAKMSASKADKARAIICVETGITYPSIKEAQRQLKINHSHIHMVLKGKCKTAKGLTFKLVTK